MPRNCGETLRSGGGRRGDEGATCESRNASSSIRKANGAGIAADPTLTGVWTPCSVRDFWRTFRLAGFRAYLAPDVWPCSPNLAIGVLRLAHQGFVTGARAGIRLSLLPCRVSRSPKSPVPAAMRRCLAETVFLCRSGLLRVGGFRLSVAFLSDQGSWPVRCHCVAPFSNEPACIWPKPPACRLSMSAWTCSTAILGIKST